MYIKTLEERLPRCFFGKKRASAKLKISVEKTSIKISSLGSTLDEFSKLLCFLYNSDNTAFWICSCSSTGFFSMATEVKARGHSCILGEMANTVCVWNKVKLNWNKPAGSINYPGESCVSLLKGQFTPKSKIHIFPLTCRDIYQSRLFWRGLSIKISASGTKKTTFLLTRTTFWTA